jgi:hypothetical protein
MKQPISLKIKARDIAIGFFGWMIISNLLVPLSIYLDDVIGLDQNELASELTFVIIIWLSVITTILVLFVKKRVWICAGIVIDVVTSVTLMVIILFSKGFMESMTPSELIFFISLPLPIAFGFLLLN